MIFFGLQEKCPDVIDILQAEVDGSNEATILREKLGLPLENSASKHEIAEQSQSTISATQKKKRKQMHEEKTELAMNVEFMEVKCWNFSIMRSMFPG